MQAFGKHISGLLSRKIVLISTLTSIVWECLVHHSQITLGIFILTSLFINKFSVTLTVLMCIFLITCDAQPFPHMIMDHLRFCSVKCCVCKNSAHFSVGILSPHCSKTGSELPEGAPPPHGALKKRLKPWCSLAGSGIVLPPQLWRQGRFLVQVQVQPSVGPS